MILDSDQNICYIFVMKNENTFEMIFFYQKRITLQIEPLCLLQKTCSCLYVKRPIIIKAKRSGILILCCEIWNEKQDEMRKDTNF